MKLKKKIGTILLISWMIIIFLFSNQNAERSQTTSNRVALAVIHTVEMISGKEVSQGKKNHIITDTRVFIRKMAHFTLYLGLGTLVYITLSNWSISKAIFYSILFCFLYACSDEIHQIFSDGRTAKGLDIMIDTTGASIGCFLAYQIKKKKTFQEK